MNTFQYQPIVTLWTLFLLLGAQLYGQTTYPPEPWPYDSLWHYLYDLNAPQEDSNLLSLTVYQVDAQGRLIRSTGIDPLQSAPYDTITDLQIFRNENGRDTLVMDRLFSDDATPYPYRTIRRSYHSNGVESRWESTSYFLYSTISTGRSIRWNNTDGNPVADTAYGYDTATGWRLDQATKYIYQNGLLQEYQLSYRSTNPDTFTYRARRTFAYDANENLIEEINYFAADPDYIFSPTFRKIFRYDSQQREQGNTYDLWDIGSMSWNKFRRDTVTYGPGPGDKQILTYRWLNGSYEEELRATTRTNSLKTISTEAFLDTTLNQWQYVQIDSTAFDNTGRETFTLDYTLRRSNGIWEVTENTYRYADSSDILVWKDDYRYSNSTTPPRYQTYTYSVRGDFSVRITDQFNPLTFQAFPNPASGWIKIKVPPSEITSLQLFTPSGRVVHEESITGPQARLELSHLPDGVYVLVLQQGEKRGIQRIVLRQ